MSVSVFPGSPDPSHDVSLTDGSVTYGFTFAGGPRVLQEIPLSAAAGPFEVKQTTWVGGRGTIKIQDDASGLYDSNNLWSTSEGMVMPALQWRYANRADCDELMPGDTASYNWTSTRQATSFVAGSSYNADKIHIIAKFIIPEGIDYRSGSALNITAEIRTNNAGDPGTLLKSKSLSSNFSPYATNPTDTIARMYTFDFTGTQALVAGTTYWVVIYTDFASSVGWQYLTNQTGGAKASTDNGSTWTSSLYNPYFRITGADTDRQWFFFELENAMYAVSKEYNGGSPYLLMNGFRGIASAGASTSLTCAQAATRDYAGAFIRIIDGTGDGQVRQITSNTTGASIVFTVPAWDVTPDATSKFVVYGTKFWDTVTGTYTLGVVANQPVVANNIAYFPKGMSTGVVSMRVNGNVHEMYTEATVKADIMFVNTDGYTGTQIWSANANLATVSNADVAAYGTSLVNLTTTTIGNTSYKITNMYTYDGNFFVFKEDGPYKFDGTRVTRFGRNFSDAPDANNGAAVADDNTYLWWSWGHSVERMLGSNVTDMLNWRSGYEGLPYNRRGLITKIISVVGWLFVVVDGGASNYSSILVWNGFGWSEFFRSHAVGTRIRNIQWQACQDTNSILWVEYAGEFLYFKFPANTSVPVNDNTQNFSFEGVMVTPIIDSGSPEMYKIFSNIRTFQDYRLPGSVGFTQERPIFIDYQTDAYIDTPFWIYAGSSSNVTLDLGGVSKIRFRFRLTGLYSTMPPVLTAYTVTGREMPPAKYQYVGTYTASTDMDTRQGEPDTNWNTIYSWLQTAAINQTKLTMRSLQASCDSKVVTVSLPVKSVDWVDEENWGGRVSFVCMET